MKKSTPRLRDIADLESALKRAAEALLHEIFVTGVAKVPREPRIEIALVPNATLKELKKNFLNKEAETVDVLSFPSIGFPSPEKRGSYLGEVYINADIAKKDFARAVFLLTHGVLHLLGYHHDKKRDTIMMEQMEREIYHALCLRLHI